MRGYTIIGLLLGVIAWLQRHQLPPPLIQWLRQTNLRLPLGLLFAINVILVGVAAGKLRDAIDDLRISHTNQYWLVRVADRLTILALVVRAFLVPYMWVWAWWNVHFYQPTVAVWLESAALVIGSFFLMPELPDRVVHILIKQPQRRVRLPMRKIFSKIGNAIRWLTSPTKSGRETSADQSVHNAISSSLPTVVSSSQAVARREEINWTEINGLDQEVGKAIQAFLEDKEETIPWIEGPTEVPPSLEVAAYKEQPRPVRKDAKAVLGINLPNDGDLIGIRSTKWPVRSRLRTIRSEAWDLARDCNNRIAALSEERGNFRNAEAAQQYEGLSFNLNYIDTIQKKTAPEIYEIAWRAVLKAREFWRTAKTVADSYGRAAAFYRNEHHLLKDGFLFRLACCQNPMEAVVLVDSAMPPLYQDPAIPNPDGVAEYEKRKKAPNSKTTTPYLKIQRGEAS